MSRIERKEATLDLGIFGERPFVVEYILTPAEPRSEEYPHGAAEEFEIFTLMHVDDDNNHEYVNIQKMLTGNDAAYSTLIDLIKPA